MTSARLTTAIAASEIGTGSPIPVNAKNPGGMGTCRKQPGLVSNAVNFTAQ
ncbi:MAG: hypothetical protein ACRD3H_17100 [Terriglobales bacterium]